MPPPAMRPGRLLYNMLQERCYFPGMSRTCKGYTGSCRRYKAVNCAKEKTALLTRPAVLPLQSVKKTGARIAECR